MKKLAFILCLMAGPAFAEEAKPPIWLMAIQLKASTINASYATEAKCNEAKKLIAPHLKNLGRADCMPVLQQ